MKDNQPSYFDAVLGGKAAPTITGIVLGGLKGVKNRLNSSNIEEKIAALRSALNYGDAGLDLVLEALQDSSIQMRRLARRLLKQKQESKARQALLNYDPWLFFTKLEKWQI